MKLRNKKTGEIKAFDEVMREAYKWDNYDSLAELNEEWEDYEEPKGTALYWMILTLENFIENEPDDKWVDLEDCKQMLEKLKAWTRLKEKGFKFKDWRTANLGADKYYFIISAESDGAEKADLNLLFGGEE